MGGDCPQRQQPVNRAPRSMAGTSKVAPSLLAFDNPVFFRRALLTWYDRNRRDLPWRRTRDPYPIWLSEIMLQQTRVGAVLDHYRAFLKLFPTLASLAAASEDAVLAAWSGLGYYRRARMLHQCAREIVNRHGGCFPQSSDALRALPGIGRYTAAAIASIAFQAPVAVVDGNIERVLARLAGRASNQRQNWENAQQLLAPSRPGDFNQAVMELGATVCLPREPRCPICPIRKWCVAQGQVPHPKPTARQQRKHIWCAIEWHNGLLRMVQRSRAASLMAGMWELPQWTQPPPMIASYEHWRAFRHSITITDYTVHVLRNRQPKDAARPRGKWIAIHQIPKMPITGLARKILKADGII